MMNRTWIICLWMCLVGFVLESCQQDDLSVSKDNNLSLQLRIGPSQTESRNVSDGSDLLNENKLTKVDCFFYPLGGEGANAVCTVLNYTLNQSGAGTVSASLTDEEVETLFGENTTCLVYMIANRPDNTILPTNTDMASLKALVIEAGFRDSETGIQTIQTDFVMDGDSEEVKLETDANGKKKVSGNVNLYRSASKIELLVEEVTEKITEGGVTWKSDPSRMYLRMSNGVKKGTIDGIQQPYAVQNADYFHTEYTQMGSVEIDSKTYYSTTVPYYSYSSDWTTDESHEVYFTLVLPWAKVTGTDADGNDILGVYRTCYYQIPVNFSEKKLIRNTHYRMKLKVGILGSFEDPDEPDEPGEEPEIPTEVTLTPSSYVIVPWSDNVINMNAQLDRPVYLVVDRNYAEMHNVNSIEIGYASSHSIDAAQTKINSVKYYSYKNPTTREVILTSSNKTDSDYGGNFDNFSLGWNENTLTFTNNTNANNFYVYQDISLTITNVVGLSEQIEIRWYPPIYIVGEKSSGVVFVNGQENGNSTEDVYSDRINYIRYDLGSTSDRDAVDGKGTNNNQNQYTVFVTSLSQGSTLRIGDSREMESTITGFGNISNAISIPKLQGYRKSSTTAGFTIAPVFKIASSYGKTYTVTQANAERRCASYQENGYPAGRWRVPTKGEIQYVVSLSTGGIIPTLFDGNYWTSNSGEYYSSSSKAFGTANSNSEHYVRCVYDVWYWGDEKINELNNGHRNNDSHWSVEYEAQP